MSEREDSIFEGNSRKPRVRFFAGKDGNFYWHIVAANNEKVSGGTEGYDSRQGAERGLLRTAQILFELGYVEVDVNLPTHYPALFAYLQKRASVGDEDAREILQGLNL